MSVKITNIKDIDDIIYEYKKYLDYDTNLNLKIKLNNEFKRYNELLKKIFIHFIKFDINDNTYTITYLYKHFRGVCNLYKEKEQHLIDKINLYF